MKTLLIEHGERHSLRQPCPSILFSDHQAAIARGFRSYHIQMILRATKMTVEKVRIEIAPTAVGINIVKRNE